MPRLRNYSPGDRAQMERLDSANRPVFYGSLRRSGALANQSKIMPTRTPLGPQIDSILRRPDAAPRIPQPNASRLSIQRGSSGFRGPGTGGPVGEASLRTEALRRNRMLQQEAARAGSLTTSALSPVTPAGEAAQAAISLSGLGRTTRSTRGRRVSLRQGPVRSTLGGRRSGSGANSDKDQRDFMYDAYRDQVSDQKDQRDYDRQVAKDDFARFDSAMNRREERDSKRIAAEQERYDKAHSEKGKVPVAVITARASANAVMADPLATDQAKAAAKATLEELNANYPPAGGTGGPAIAPADQAAPNSPEAPVTNPGAVQPTQRQSPAIQASEQDVVDYYQQEYGRDPTPEEIQQELGTVAGEQATLNPPNALPPPQVNNPQPSASYAPSTPGLRAAPQKAGRVTMYNLDGRPVSINTNKEPGMIGEALGPARVAAEQAWKIATLQPISPRYRQQTVDDPNSIDIAQRRMRIRQQNPGISEDELHQRAWDERDLEQIVPRIREQYPDMPEYQIMELARAEMQTRRSNPNYGISQPVSPKLPREVASGTTGPRLRRNWTLRP